MFVDSYINCTSFVTIVRLLVDFAIVKMLLLSLNNSHLCINIFIQNVISVILSANFCCLL